MPRSESYTKVYKVSFDYFYLRSEKAVCSDWQDAVVDFEVQATEADPGELTVEKEIGEFELHDDDCKVQQFAEVVFV